MTCSDDSIFPFDPEDFVWFIDARPIRDDHHRRGDVIGHTDEQGVTCQECRVMAFGGLRALAGRARRRGWSRAEGRAHLDEEPAAVDTLVREGGNLSRTDEGLLAKAVRAGHGAVYRQAFDEALARGDLDVDAGTAADVLGWVIRSVQDQTSVVAHGELVPWDRLEDDLEWGARIALGELEPGCRAQAVWTQIEAACQRLPRAARLLDDHVYRHSANASRHTIAHHPDPDTGSTLDPIELATNDQSLTACSSRDGLYNEIVLHVYWRLHGRADTRRGTAVTEARRALLDTYGADSADTDEATALCHLIADETLTLIRQDHP